MYKVSILVATYNRAPLLDRALLELTKQTYCDLEIIISDNASEDDTKDVVRKYMAIDDRIVYHQNESNIGIMKNYEKLLELAEGEYCIFATDDDLLVDCDYIKDAMECVENKSSLVFAGHSSFDLNTKDMLFEIKHGFPLKNCGLKVWLSGVLNQTIETAWLFNKQMFLRNIKGSLTDVHQYEVFSRCMFESEVFYIDRPVVHYYTHANTLTNTVESNIISYLYIIEQFARYLKNIHTEAIKKFGSNESIEMRVRTDALSFIESIYNRYVKVPEKDETIFFLELIEKIKVYPKHKIYLYGYGQFGQQIETFLAVSGIVPNGIFDDHCVTSGVNGLDKIELAEKGISRFFIIASKNEKNMIRMLKALAYYGELKPNDIVFDYLNGMH